MKGLPRVSEANLAAEDVVDAPQGPEGAPQAGTLGRVYAHEGAVKG